MIYFDNNASTAVAPEVFDAMKPFLTTEFGNPSSGHAAASAARSAIKQARENVAKMLGASDPGEIVFTSGGTESDNWAILGALELQPEKKHIVTTAVEHEAVRTMCKKLEKQGCEVTWLGVDEHGGLDLDELKDALRTDTAIVSIMTANNQTGVIFPVAEAAAIVKANSDALFHADGVNAAGKMPIDLKTIQIDMMSISGHKFYAPKGIGALYIRKGVDLPSSLIGGGQENGRRAGTEAAHQIAGLGAAAALVNDHTLLERIRTLRDRLESGILASIPNASVNGGGNRLPNVTNISFENTNGEMIMHELDEIGVCVSTGSACSDAHRKASGVLAAMNLPYSRAMGAIRFSLGKYNTEAEVEYVLDKLPAIVERLNAMAV
ncbi:MAG: aminotransferase class V-fold PLP-dependent enzyme [Pyrinomonadaceae bacterium]|nr:aminotransferase class V-fold PLP-dependent enzyme [Acidobacteriota bacterium]MBK7932811.1 aminotransferase class V-fold PLP-dependent enzyme [Acidobacteriota bacterium]MBP7374975.1 aminotransferase class V-fold PLP-dependent enzyme [Pyrinomonadaceae bacterium]